MFLVKRYLLVILTHNRPSFHDQMRRGMPVGKFHFIALLKK